MKKMLMLMTLVLMQAAVATGARAASVKYDMDGSADFRSYRKIAWASGPARGGEAIADRRIRTAIEIELESKGYELVSAAEADLVVDYAAVVRRRGELSEEGGPRFGRNLRMRSHPEGTLLVSFEEAKGGRVVWHGAVTDAVASNPEKADKKTEKAVGQLLEKFPSRTKTP